MRFATLVTRDIARDGAAEGGDCVACSGNVLRYARWPVHSERVVSRDLITAYNTPINDDAPLPLTTTTTPLHRVHISQSFSHIHSSSTNFHQCLDVERAERVSESKSCGALCLGLVLTGGPGEVLSATARSFVTTFKVSQSLYVLLPLDIRHL